MLAAAPVPLDPALPRWAAIVACARVRKENILATLHLTITAVALPVWLSWPGSVLSAERLLVRFRVRHMPGWRARSPMDVLLSHRCFSLSLLL